MIRGSVPLSPEAIRAIVLAPNVVQPSVFPAPAERQREPMVAAPVPPALVDFPSRRAPMMMPPVDAQRPVAHFTPLPTVAIPIE